MRSVLVLTLKGNCKIKLHRLEQESVQKHWFWTFVGVGIIWHPETWAH